MKIYIPYLNAEGEPLTREVKETPKNYVTTDTDFSKRHYYKGDLGRAFFFTPEAAVAAAVDRTRLVVIQAECALRKAEAELEIAIKSDERYTASVFERLSH